MKSYSYKGSCSCNRWQVEIEVKKTLPELNPRLLSSTEKLDRWGSLWGVIIGLQKT